MLQCHLAATGEVALSGTVHKLSSLTWRVNMESLTWRDNGGLDKQDSAVFVIDMVTPK